MQNCNMTSMIILRKPSKLYPHITWQGNKIPQLQSVFVHLSRANVAHVFREGNEEFGKI